MESHVSAFVHELAPGARVTYAVAHTFKFEIPASEVRSHTTSPILCLHLLRFHQFDRPLHTFESGIPVMCLASVAPESHLRKGFS